MIGAEQSTEDDIDDIFNLLDINGDGHLDRGEFSSLLRTFFRVLEEKNVQIKVEKESDIVI